MTIRSRWRFQSTTSWPMQRTLLVLVVLAVLGGLLAWGLFQDSSSRTTKDVDSAEADARFESASVETTDQDPTRTATPEASTLSDPGFRERRVEIRPTPSDPSKPKVEVSVRITDQDGYPIHEAQAGLIQFPVDNMEFMDVFRALEGEEVEGLARAVALSDEQGRARIRVDRVAQRWILFARGRGYELAGDDLEIDRGEDQVDAGTLVLRPGGSIEVQLLDEASRPVSKAIVMLQGDLDMGEQQRVPWRIRFSDEQGLCQFDNLPLNPMALVAQRPGYLAAEQEDLHPLPEGHRQSFVLLRGAALEGRVVTAKGDPAANVALQLFKQEDDFDLLHWITAPALKEPWAVSDADGHFQGLGLLPEPSYRVRARAGNRIEVDSDPVRAGDTVLIRLPEVSGLSGQLVLEGSRKPLGKARVLIVHRPDGVYYEADKAIESDTEGRFHEDLQAGEYWMIVNHPDAEWHSPQAFPVDGFTDLGPVEIPRGGSLELTVLSAESGEPVSAPSLVAHDPFQDDRELSPIDELEFNEDAVAQEHQRTRRLAVFRDPPIDLGRGRLRWSGLTPGEHHFQVRASGFVDQALQLRVRAGETHRQEIRLAPAASLVVSVARADGGPVENVSLRLSGLEPAEIAGFEQDRHGDNGQDVRFRNLRPGKYAIDEIEPSLRAKHNRLGEAELKPGENKLHFLLPGRHSVVVRVQDAMGPVEGARVGIRTPLRDDVDEWEIPWLLHRRAERSNAEGEVEFESITDGEYAVVVIRAGSLPQTTPFQVSGSSRVLEVHLDGYALSGVVSPAPLSCRVRLRRLTESPDALDRREQEVWGELDHIAFSDEDDLANMYIDESGAMATCDDQGRFLFRDLQSGRYELQAQAEGFYQKEVVRVTVREESLESIRIELAAQALLSLRVHGFTRQDHKFFTAELVDVNGEAVCDTLYLTESGQYEFQKVPAGTHTLRIKRLRDDGAHAVVNEYPVQVDPHHPVEIEWTAP